MKLDLTGFMLRLVPHVIATAPAIARALFHQTGGDVDKAKAELRFVRDHRGSWLQAQAALEARFEKLKDDED